MIIDGQIQDGDHIKGTFDTEKNKIALQAERKDVAILSTDEN